MCVCVCMCVFCFSHSVLVDELTIYPFLPFTPPTIRTQCFRKESLSRAECPPPRSLAPRSLALPGI